MTIETEVASLTQATTDLLSAVNVKKAALDAAEANAVNALDSFESQYIGARSSAPATDADGDPVQTGALYYNTTNTTMYVYSGSAWDALVDNLVIDPNATMLSNIATNGNDIKFGDNDKATFGASDDLQIYHDGTKNRVVGSVDVTGTITADGLTVDGESDLNATVTIRHANPRIKFIENDTVNANTQFSNDAGNFAISTMSDAESTFTKRFNLNHATGDVSFYEDTGTTAKFVWSSSTESLGIGGSPNNVAGLHIQRADPVITMTDTSGTTDNKNWEMRALGASGFEGFYFRTVNDARTVYTNRMMIDSSGNVGIGTNAPDAVLELDNGNDSNLKLGNALSFNNYTNEGAGIEFERSTGGYTMAIAPVDVDKLNIASRGGILFGTGGSGTYGATTERARIDSSGNLLVGKTSSGYTTAGFEVGGSGAAAITRSSDQPLALNRLTNDGSIVGFYKDGATVGSIGTNASSTYIGTGDTGVLFWNAQDAIAPYNTGSTVSNGVISLGVPNYRFKDLYLSGGVYLGGTGAANKLDDYETGNWTPAVGINNFSSSPTTLTGNYTKIGRIVTARLTLSFSSSITMSSYSTITGLPFSTAGQAGAIASTNTVGSHARVAASGTQLFFTYLEGSPNTIELAITYQTS